MDKNQLTGLLLISLMVMVYFYFFSPTTPPPTSPIHQDTIYTERRDGVVEPGRREETILAPSTDTLAQARMRERLGVFADRSEGEERESVLENKDVRITFNNQGGRIKSVLLKNYLTFDKRPLYIFNEESNHISLLVNTPQGPIDLSTLFFDINQATQSQETGENNTLSYSLSVAPGQTITQNYTLAEEGFLLDYNLDLQGMNNIITNDLVQLYWLDQIEKVERSLEESRRMTTINYYLANDDFDYLDETSVDKEQEQINNPVKWVAIKQKFFTSAIIGNDTYFRNGIVTTELPPDTGIVKTAEVLMNLSLQDLEAGNGNFTFYFGPNNYQILKKVTPGFSNNVYLGWGIFSWFNKFLIIPIFNFLENYIANYGIIIIILVLIIKILLSPLSYKSYISMAKTKVLKPELDIIKEKHEGDMQKIQAEQMQLYQKVGINPLSGCIPMLLQLPILLAMFNFFPNSIELRQESFLWADDLSTYDSIMNLPFHIPAYGSHVSLFTLLMTASTILYTWSNSQMTTVQGPMKTMQYIMPIMFLFFLNSYSSGLTFYYFVSNIVTFGQQAIIRRFVDEDKIKAVLEENKKRNVNKKKSKFQQRLEEAMKTSEELKKSKKSKS
ncbi:membrane protein insertase YidC [soil metagenome]